MSDTTLTKQDLLDALKNVASKDDLKNLVTKDDLKNFPTKLDLDSKINDLRDELKDYILENNEIVFNGVENLLKEQYVSKLELTQILQSK